MSRAETFIKDCTRHCSNELCAIEDRYGKKVVSYREWLTPEQAIRAVKIAREEMIEKACNFIYEQLNNGIMECGDIETFINNFKKVMEK